MGTAGNATGWQGEIRHAGADDIDDVALGFCHLTFYANGPAGWVEEIVVRRQDRGQGIGRILMTAFENWAAPRDAR